MEMKNEIMNKWKLHTHFGKSWYKATGYFQYNICFLPNIELDYNSIINEESESPSLTIQWLIWFFTIWRSKDL